MCRPDNQIYFFTGEKIMAVEKTLVLIKPDGRKRKLTGLAIDRLDVTGLDMIGAKVVTDSLAREHYRSLGDKPFFESLVKFLKGEYHDIPGSRMMALVYQGENAVAVVRKIAGATDPEDAAVGTIRNEFGRVCRKSGLYENVVHASSDPVEAEREIKLWFSEGEIAD